jgi:predicted PurR-regulated permease PerM
LLAVVITIIVSLPLSSAATAAQNRGLPRAAGALAAVIVATVIAAGIGYAVVPEFIARARQFAGRLPATVLGAERYLGLGHVKPPSFSREAGHAVQCWLSHPDVGPLLQIGSSLLSVLVLVVLIGLAAFLIALNPEPLMEMTLRLLPSQHRGRAREVFDRIRTAWLGWLTAVGIDMLVLGGLLFVGMTIVGLPFAWIEPLEAPS